MNKNLCSPGLYIPVYIYQSFTDHYVFTNQGYPRFVITSKLLDLDGLSHESSESRSIHDLGHPGLRNYAKPRNPVDAVRWANAGLMLANRLWR